MALFRSQKRPQLYPPSADAKRVLAKAAERERLENAARDARRKAGLPVAGRLTPLRRHSSILA